MQGTGLENVAFCKFGNGSASAIPLLPTPTVVVCKSTAIGDGTEPDGATFAEGPRHEGEAAEVAGRTRGFAPVLLSRDGSSFFHTATTFFYYPAPANFSSIFPGGGPVGIPTNVTITGEGFLGFDGQAEQVRCRWGGAEAATDVTVPSYISDTELRCESFARQSPGTVKVYVSLNAGVDFHATGQSFQFYTQPILLRTGCLGATKGCLTTGPTLGDNPVQVHGIGLNVFIDYVSARCRFQSATTVNYAGLQNGSITVDGSSVYCITPRADVDEKIVTQVAPPPT